MKQCKEMNAKQLAEYILSGESGDIIYFGNDFDEHKMLSCYVSDWHGVQKIRLFDADRIIIGDMGGFPITAACVDKSILSDTEIKEYLIETIQIYFGSCRGNGYSGKANGCFLAGLRRQRGG